MEGFWLGVLVGLIIILFVWVACLEIKMRATMEQVKKTNMRNVDAAIENSIAKLSPDEVDSMLSKDLGRSITPPIPK
jgi:PBP1b-binding outer membrane lipoprotein LpoB